MWASAAEEAPCKSSNFSSLKTESHFGRYEGSQRVFTTGRLLKQPLKVETNITWGKDGSSEWPSQRPGLRASLIPRTWKTFILLLLPRGFSGSASLEVPQDPEF